MSEKVAKEERKIEVMIEGLDAEFEKEYVTMEPSLRMMMHVAYVKGAIAGSRLSVPR